MVDTSYHKNIYAINTMALGDEAAQRNTTVERKPATPTQAPTQPAKVEDTTPSSKEN
jgi:hypothetical protein|tara:strand:- start:797 stop:967 length:171 start_codon:yes stop_codon:yes gene_type:complete